MGVNSLPKTVNRQRRVCDLNPGPSAPESSMLTTRLPSHPQFFSRFRYFAWTRCLDGSFVRMVAQMPLQHLGQSRPPCRG